MFSICMFSQHAYGGRKALVRKMTLSRSVHVPEERWRTRAMLWHWDTLPRDVIKVWRPTSVYPNPNPPSLPAI